MEIVDTLSNGTCRMIVKKMGKREEDCFSVPVPEYFSEFNFKT